MIQKPKTTEELERLIIEHPVSACLHMKLGLLEEIDKNGKDMMDAMEWTLEGLIFLALCVLIAFGHMAKLVFYPYFLIRKFLILRKHIKEHPGCLRFSAQSRPTSEK